MDIEPSKLLTFIATFFGVVMGIHWLYHRNQKISEIVAIVILLLSTVVLLFAYNYSDLSRREEELFMGIGYFCLSLASFYIISRNSYLKKILFSSSIIFIISVFYLLLFFAMGVAGIIGGV